MGDDWDAATYDRISDPQLRWGVEVVNRLDLKGDERVLDAGCGTGRVTSHLLARLPEGRVVALDASRAMIDQARVNLSRYSEGVEYVVADLSAPLPLDTPVDAVFSTATFHWISDHDALFRNLSVVMRPGAQLVAQCGGRGNIATVQGAVRELGYPTDDTYFASPDETVRRLRQAGFFDVMVWLHDEPTSFEAEDQLAEFLATVVLRRQLAGMRVGERDSFVSAVIARLPRPEIDYVRLNISAVRDGSAGPRAQDWDCRW